jgi:hypothetical protein
MLSPTAGADIAAGAAAVITAVAWYIPLAGAKRTKARPAAREYPRFLPVQERTGRFTREPAPAERERDPSLTR